MTQVAAIQHPPIFLERDRSLDRAEALVGETAAEGSQVVAFGETWLPGFPVWIFGASNPEDHRVARIHRKYAEQSVEVPGPATDRLAKIARQSQVWLVIGVSERDALYSRSTLFDSVLVFSPTGELVGHHRKLTPSWSERLLFGNGDGAGLRAHPTPHGRLGALCCWEHFNPLSRFALHADGEEIHCALWPEVTRTHEIATAHYALEARCFVICAGSFLAEDDLGADFDLHDALPALGPLSETPGVVLPGGSGVIGPDGSWSVGPVLDRATTVTGELEATTLLEHRMLFDVAGHSQRADVFELTIDRRRRPLIDRRD